jgi:hypothetical protein
MAEESFTLTGNRLNIPNPNRTCGLIQLFMGATLGLAVALRFPVVAQTVESLGNSGFRGLSPLTGYVLVAMAVASAFAALFALGYFIAGLRNVLTFFVPTEVPGPLDGSSQREIACLNDLFVKRVVRTFTTPSLSLRAVAKLVLAPQLLFSFLYQRRLAETLLRSVLGWGLLVAVCTYPAVSSDQLLFAQDGGALNEILDDPSRRMPFPLFLYAVAAVAIATHALAVVVSERRLPEVQVSEIPLHLDKSGNPINFYNHVLEAIQQLRRGNFPNRDLLRQEPKIGRLTLGDTDNYEAQVVVETQPLPRSCGLQKAALVTAVGGAMLVCGGLLMLMNMSDLLADDGALLFGQSSLLTIAGLSAVVSGLSLRGQSYSLFNTFTFHSDSIWIQFKGTYTASQLALGDGRGGLLHTSRPAVLSDSYLRIWASRIMSACSPLSGERILIDSRVDGDFAERLGRLRETIVSFKDSGGNLTGVNLEDGDLGRMLAANVQIHSALATATAVIPALPAVPHPQNLPHSASAPNPSQDGELKPCPDCGESVRAAARKCRFCNYRFDQDAGGA